MPDQTQETFKKELHAFAGEYLKEFPELYQSMVDLQQAIDEESAIEGTTICTLNTIMKSDDFRNMVHICADLMKQSSFPEVQMMAADAMDKISTVFDPLSVIKDQQGNEVSKLDFIGSIADEMDREIDRISAFYEEHDYDYSVISKEDVLTDDCRYIGLYQGKAVFEAPDRTRYVVEV